MSRALRAMARAAVLCVLASVPLAATLLAGWWAA